MGAVFSPLFFELDFLSEKLLMHYEKIEELEPGWHMSRFGAVLFDLEYINLRPLTGWGLHMDAFQLHDFNRYATGNGLTGLARMFGVLTCAAYLLCIFRWFWVANLGVPALSLWFLMVLQLNSQMLFKYPIFLIFLFPSFLRYGK